MSHWATSYIGEPWERGEADCWGFARRVWNERFGWHVPPVEVDSLYTIAVAKAFRDSAEYRNWQRVSEAREGDAILMGKGREPHHIGIWLDIDGGRILHAIRGPGVICQSVQGARISGWHVLRIYRRKAR